MLDQFHFKWNFIRLEFIKKKSLWFSKLVEEKTIKTVTTIYQIKFIYFDKF